MRPLLGDFLVAASDHIDAATSDIPQLSADAARAMIKELDRLTAVMARTANAFVVDDGTDPARLDAPALTALDAQAALRHAAARMHTAAAVLGEGGDDDRHPAGARLTAAAAHLSAGHDLLQSHFAPQQSGTRHGNSLWAPAIVSTPVNMALTAVIGDYASRLAPWMLELATAPLSRTLPAPARVAISAACRWLRIAEAAAWALNRQPGTIAEQALLRAIPVNAPPPRLSPRGGEPVPDLCAGAIATAERLRHLAHVPATGTDSAQTGLATTWQRTAQGAAITGHCSELILRQLADSAAKLPISHVASGALAEAADKIRGAWMAWRAVAHEWDTVTTGPAATLTPAAAAIGDLTLWVGRLAYTDPVWTPSRSHASPARTTNSFACDGNAIGQVVGALHQVGDALAHIAASNRENVRSAAAACDLYVPTRLLSAECDAPYRYVPALPAMTDALLATYDAAFQAATHAVTALDGLALGLKPQPAVFATLRAIAPLTSPFAADGPAIHSGRTTRRPRPGQVEQTLRRHGVDEPTLLARAADIDDAAQDLINATTAPAQRRAAASRAALHASKDSSTRREHPAHLAAKDVPPYTSSNIPLPRLVPINHPLRHRTTTRHRQTP
jgi:hypothetical protein